MCPASKVNTEEPENVNIYHIIWDGLKAELII